MCNRVEVEVPSSNSSTIFAFDAKVNRHLFTYDRNGRVYDEANSHHVLSFWSSSVREDGSWDAVLLVDPGPGTHVRCLKTGELHPLRTRLANDASMPKRFLYPEIESLLELPENCSQWATAHGSIGYHCMFDDTLRAFRKANLTTIATDDPLSVVELPRKIVISALIAYLRRRYLNLINIQNDNAIPQIMRQNYLASFSKNSYSNWSSEFFDFIVGSQAAMKVFAREIDDNAAALGLENTKSAAPQWEKDGWQAIKELTGVVAETVDAFAHGYLQYVTIQEARASSSNAQSLSRITVLTMLFIPLSTVASIFSMGGEFLPGQAKAWMFWVAALPLLAVIAYLYWRQMVTEVLQKKKQNLLPLHKEQDCKKL
ncbi:uncharacterized protein ALTATR162_LOCUS4399 [Alternaria atra]|uniref:Uncharacterized protein n=1 Tax=Alternaria atra TaxID=119953 RepID=A0A8J2I2N0_9PLEO|nr:uncharacterized protein ALTATR162_LOCUS4399 [Alternaria atra]CAG5156602.1 unnamed protein product [Alternaria atra]